MHTSASSIVFKVAIVYEALLCSRIGKPFLRAIAALKTDGNPIHFEVIVRLDTDIDVEYYHNGGILHDVLRKMLAKKGGTS